MVIQFSDTRKWNGKSFLDFLEINEVPFNYDGKELNVHVHFEQKARRLWHHLTGTYSIGVFL